MEGRLLTDNFLFLTICVFVSFVRTLSVYAAQSLLCSTAVFLCSTAVFLCSTAVFLCSTAVFPCSTAVFHAAQSLIHAAQSFVLAAQPPFHAAEVALTGHRTAGCFFLVCQILCKRKKVHCLRCLNESMSCTRVMSVD